MKTKLDTHGTDWKFGFHITIFPITIKAGLQFAIMVSIGQGRGHGQRWHHQLIV